MIPASWVVTGVVTLAAGVYVWHCEDVKEQQAIAKGVAEQQARDNALKALRDLKAKERSDENYERRIARLDADVKRLRQRPASELPSAAPGPGSSPTATFDRAELDSALRSYRDEVARGREEIRELVGEGAAAVEGLGEAKEWAKDR